MTTRSALPTLPGLEAIAAAAEFARHALAPATLRAYKADWTHFTGWCHGVALAPLPAAPETVAAYLASLAGRYTRSTIQRRLAAIGEAHRLAGESLTASHPAIRNTLRGMFRQHGKPPRKAAALGRLQVQRLIAGCDDTLAGSRDRALLLLGFAGALRRSELVALERDLLTIDATGARIVIPRGKGDQEGQGALIGIPRGRHADTCPVAALEAWLRISGCTGPVFRKVGRGDRLWDKALTPHAVWEIVKKRAAEAGLSASAFESLSPHGLRAGFITDAYRAGARDVQIMNHSRHKDARTMYGYIRRAKLMEDNPVDLLGL